MKTVIWPTGKLSVTSRGDIKSFHTGTVRFSSGVHPNAWTQFISNCPTVCTHSIPQPIIRYVCMILLTFMNYITSSLTSHILFLCVQRIRTILPHTVLPRTLPPPTVPSDKTNLVWRKLFFCLRLLL